MLMRRAVRGFSLIEMGIALAIIAILITVGLPSMTVWLNNAQIRTAGETMLAGLNLARTEAIRRNQVVRFQLVSSLDASCVLSTSAANWVVSQQNPAGACGQSPSEDPATAQIIQAQSSAEGMQKVSVAAVGAAVAHFNGIGRLTSPSGAANMTTIDLSNPTGGACQHVDPDGEMRCLRITITAGGQIKMCDPAVTDATDPRIC